VQVTGVDELEAGDPVAVARENARRKHDACVTSTTGPSLRGPEGETGVAGALVLAVDTVVALGDRIFGKPADEAQARATLDALAGAEHRVVSGFVLGGVAGHAETRVRMRAGLTEWYVPHGEWRDRAGGYAIQGRGAALVERIDGDYLNVVGLPVAALLDLRPDLIAMAR
jgi:septum formation protein